MRRLGIVAVGLALLMTLLALGGSPVRAQPVASIALPSRGTVQLYSGCNNIALSFPDGTDSQTVVNAVTPAGVVQAMWRHNAALNTFEGFSPAAPQASDLRTVNQWDAVWLCLAAAPSNTVWLCRPGLANNPCESDLTTTVISADGSSTVEEAAPATDPPIDCFYVYPTVSGQATTNANLDTDPEVKTVTLHQAARFSQVCKVYAPVYRQFTLSTIGKPGAATAADRALAYGDVLSAWQAYRRDVWVTQPQYLEVWLEKDALSGIFEDALAEDDVRRYSLPPDFPKATDTRRAAFAAKYGDVAVELDALPLAVLHTRLVEEVETRMDLEALSAVREAERADRERLVAALTPVTGGGP
jgi:hypothetical protein